MWQRTYLVCWHQVNQHRVQQLLRYGVTLTDDGAHQVHHVHVHFLVVAVAGGKQGKKGQMSANRQHIFMIKRVKIRILPCVSSVFN